MVLQSHRPGHAEHPGAHTHMLCRLERSNLFEDMCGLLSRTAYPAAKGALGALHLVSLDALTAILQAIAAE